MKRNIVLIVLDTVRKDYFDKFATKLSEVSSTSFSQCRAASSWSVPSHASIFTGKLPHQHDVHSESFGSSFNFSAKLEGKTFLDDLPGYNTFGVSSNIYINREFGFDTLFDDFVDHSIGDHYSAVPFPEVSTDFSTEAESWIGKQIRGFRKALKSDEKLKSICNGAWLAFGDKIERLPLPRVGDNGAKANAKSIREFAAESEEPFFAFANFMDAHNPLQNSIVYDQSLHTVRNSWSSNEREKWELLIDGCDDENYTENYRELYGVSIDYLDRVVHQLVTDLQSATENETTVIITADHGHNLGYDFEDNYFHHTASLSEGILHVPLEIINPPSEWPNEVSEKYSQTNMEDLISLVEDESWNESIIGDDPVVAENIGLLGESSKVDYDGEERIDHEYWNRMIRCGYESNTKFEWDSLSNTNIYKLDAQRPCWQSINENHREIPDYILGAFDRDIDEYKTKWENSKQDLSFDDSVEGNLRDLGYL